jgi:enoyl-CoA hydratase/carnithine racemase
LVLQITKHVEVHELRLARPPVNALDPALIRALTAAIESAPAAGARALVLSGATGMFSAGLDVPALLALDRTGIRRFWDDFFSVMRAIARSSIPIASAITGHCPAGGAVLAIFSDYRVMAEGNFTIGLNEVQVGLPVPAVIAGALERLVGTRQAEQMLVSGALIGPAEALSHGLVDRVVPIDRVVPAALEWAHHIASLPREACAATRRTVRADLAESFHNVDAALFEHMTDVWFGPETQGAMQALMQRLAARKR